MVSLAPDFTGDFGGALQVGRLWSAKVTPQSTCFTSQPWLDIGELRAGQNRRIAFVHHLRGHRADQMAPKPATSAGGHGDQVDRFILSGGNNFGGSIALSDQTLHRQSAERRAERFVQVLFRVRE